MGKKYLETKDNSLEASVLNVWQKAVEQTKEIADNAQMYKNPEENTQKEEVKVEGYLELDFKDKRTAEKAYDYINNEIWASGNPPYDDFNQEGSSLQIDTDGNLNRRNQMLKDLKALPSNMKFKVTVNEARQLKDPKKEVMVVKGNKVVVIDKKDQKDYLKKGYKLAEASGDKEAYTKFFNSALKKFKVNSPAELKGDAKKKFYDYIDANWEGDNEKVEAAMAQVREFKIQGMKAALASIWNVEEGKNPFKVEDDKKIKSKNEKTLTGKKAAIINLKPEIKD